MKSKNLAALAITLAAALSAADVAAAFGFAPDAIVGNHAGLTDADAVRSHFGFPEGIPDDLVGHSPVNAVVEDDDLDALADMSNTQLQAAIRDMQDREEAAQQARDAHKEGSAEWRRADRRLQTVSAALEAALGESEKRRPQARTRPTVPAQPRSAQAGANGFNGLGDYLAAVRAGSQVGAQPDPRLIANAPTSFGQEGVGSDGGFAVPPDFRSTIIKRIMGEDSLLSRTDQMTTTSNSITVPTDETTPWQSTGGIQAYWENEGGQITQSKPQLTEKTVKANKIVALVPMTDELLSDAASMAAYVGSKAPDKIFYKVNEAIIRGTGVGQPLGFLNSGALITVPAESSQVADTVTFKNIVAMWSRMPADSRARAIWLANGDVEPQLMQMQFPGSGTAVPAYLPPGGLSASPYGTLLGRPVVVSEVCSAMGDVGDLSFVDLSQYMSVTKGGGIRQDVSIHLWFDYDIVAFRFVLRVGGNPWWNAPITRANGLSRSPFVALAAR